MKNISICVLLLVVSFFTVLGEINCVFSTENATLAQSPPVGARVIGMGGAFIAVADDAHALLLNPAGLCQVANFQLSTSYFHPYLVGPDINNEFLGVVYPINSFAAVGAGYLRLAGPFYSENTGTFSFSAAPFRKGFAIGASFKYFWSGVIPIDEIRLKDPTFDASDPLFNSGKSPGINTVGFDFGILVQPKKALKLGVAVENLWSRESKFHNSDYFISLPQCYRLGAAYTKPSPWYTIVFPTGSLEINHNSGRTDVHLGGEAWLRGPGFNDAEIAVRGGVVILDKQLFKPKITFGPGVRFAGDTWGVQFDYALSWLPVHDLFENRVSLSLVFLPGIF